MASIPAPAAGQPQKQNPFTSATVLGDRDERNMQTKCTSYSIIGNTKDPLSRPGEWLPIYHCRGFKWNLQEIWPGMKHFD
jgi:hypothetical protein